VLLQDVEEVFAFEHAVFWHICAVDSVLNSVVTEFGSGKEGFELVRESIG